ncbi:phosphatase PAP2 family protein [Candidatus Pacearchaeota archaeon]|nr:phosphatase PAP2 family protein [Candidatus Pacearchaeota archaeon]
MKAKNKIILLILIVISAIVSLYFDNDLIKLIPYLRNGTLNSLFLAISFIGSGVIVALIATLLFFWKKNKRKWILPLWVSFVISASIGFILKITIQRARPFQTGIIQLVSGLQESISSWDFSFPSFHSMFAFCVLPILSQQFPKLKKFWIAFAILVAFSRIYLGVHFVSDVIAGGAIGYLIGMMIVKAEKENRFGEKIYRRVFGK